MISFCSADPQAHTNGTEVKIYQAQSRELVINLLCLLKRIKI